jgi:hypothetical protein
MEPSRFLDEVPAELVDRLEPAFPSAYQQYLPPYRFHANPYPGRSHGRRHRAQEDAAFSYEDEDQSAGRLKVGMRVRHPQFGIGTVLSTEELADDVKLVVRFAVGSKTLRAKYAKLELA